MKNSPSFRARILHFHKRDASDDATITFVVDQKPTRAGIDPYNKLIDRNPEDNMIDVSKM